MKELHILPASKPEQMLQKNRRKGLQSLYYDWRPISGDAVHVREVQVRLQPVCHCIEHNGACSVAVDGMSLMNSSMMSKSSLSPKKNVFMMLDDEATEKKRAD